MTKITALLVIAAIISLPLAADLAIPANPEVVRSIVFHNGKILIGTFGLGLWQVSSSDISQLKIPHPMISLMMPHDNKLWVATAGGGCFYLEAESNAAIQLPFNDSFAKLHGIFIDDSQPLLIGSVGNGSAILLNGDWKALEASSATGRGWVNSIALFAERIFIGTSTGVHHTQYPATPENWNPVKLDGIKGTNQLLPFNGNLYAATTSDGIYEINAQFEPKRIEDSFGQTHFVVNFNDQLVAGGKYCLWLIAQGQAHHLENYDFSEPKCATTVEDKLFIGTMKGEIITSNDLETFDKSYEFRHNNLEEAF